MPAVGSVSASVDPPASASAAGSYYGTGAFEPMYFEDSLGDGIFGDGLAMEVVQVPRTPEFAAEVPHTPKTTVDDMDFTHDDAGSSGFSGAVGGLAGFAPAVRGGETSGNQ